MVLVLAVSTAQAQTETIVFSTGVSPWTTGYNGNVTITANYAINTSWKLTFTLPTNATLGTAWPTSGVPNLNVGNITTSNGAILGSGTVNIPANTPFVVNFGVSGVTNNAAPTNFVFTNGNKTNSPTTATSPTNCLYPSNIFPCIGNVGIGSFDATIQPKSPFHLQGTSFLHGTGYDNDYSVLFKRSNGLNGYQISEYAPLRNIMTFSNSQTSGMNNRPSVSIGEPINPYYRTFEVNGGHTGLYGTLGSDAASQQNILQLISHRTNAVSKKGGTHYLNFSHDLYPSPSNQEYSIINSHEYKDPAGPEAPKDLVLQNNNGNVGIGFYTAPLTERLHVNGSIKLEGSNAGLVFADGTKLTTATDGGLWQKTGTAGHIQYNNGNVGIGLTAAPAEKLHIKGNIKVEGKIAAVEICANPTSSWCDYVFEPDYQLPTLASVQTFLTQNKHLPDVPSAADVKANGYNMNKMDTALLKKLEEAYLYILDLEARVKTLELKK